MAAIPYSYDPTVQKEGQSWTRSPLFDGTDYGYWKLRMTVHIKGIDKELWKIIENGYSLAKATPELALTSAQIKDNDRLETLDNKAKNILYCGLNKTEFNRISSCDNAQQIWTRLEVIHEGTTEVKKTRIRTLQHLFQNFVMFEGESIDVMLSRFADIVNPLKALGKEIDQEDQVSRVLSSLKGANWIQKRIGIEEGKSMETLTFEELMGKLKAFEVQLKVMDIPAPATSIEVKPEEKQIAIKEEAKEKSMAFKAYKSFKPRKVVVDDSDDEIEDLTNTFRRFLVNNKKFKGNVLGSRKKGEDSSIPRCYRCNSKDHLKPDCPLMKKDKGNKEKDKQVLYATWGESDAEMLSSDEEDNNDGFKNGVCFMAYEDSQVTSEPSDDSLEYAHAKYDELYDMYEGLLVSLEDMAPKFIQLKKDKKELVGELGSAKYELASMTTKYHETKDLLGSYEIEKFDALEIKFEEAKSHIANLIEENKKLEEQLNTSISNVSFKDTDISLLNVQISIFEDKIVELEKRLSSQDSTNANERLTTSISPSNELENKLNARISELLKENEKWKIDVKKFTISQKSVNTMLDDIGSYVNRQGLGYKKNNQQSKPKRAKKSVTTNFHNHTNHHVDFSTKEFSYVKSNPWCEKVLVSYNCFDKYYANKCVWIPKQVTNKAGTNHVWLPKGVPSAGTSNSRSNK